jgi:hypothetical protein
MLSISDFNKDEYPFDSAVRVVSNYGDGDLLKGMKAIEEIYLNGDEDTEDAYHIEFNCYNAVFKPMSEMFHGK